MKKDAIDRYYEMCLQKAVRVLKERYPEFLYPLSRLKFEKQKQIRLVDGSCLSTDGVTIFYDANRMKEKTEKKLAHDIMHIVLHGMLGHFLHHTEYEDVNLRDVCMDMQVAYFLYQLGVAESHEEQEVICTTTEENEVDLSMSQYYYAKNNTRLAGQLLRKEARVRCDDHREWDREEQKNESENQSEVSVNKLQEAREKLWEQARKYAGITEGDDRERLLERLASWAKLRAAGEGYGNERDGESGEFAVDRISAKNYKELLRELTTTREICREVPDSIDPMLYQYGFELNEDSPLLEPAEYSEQKSVDVIVIAIDVSFSCCDSETMSEFWSETYQCISQWSRNGYRGEFLILQCDVEIQKEEWLKAEDFTEAPETVSIKGFGGTSFVPVFEKIEQLKERGQRIDALIYLTDGDGVYPKEETDYPVYFIMPGEYYDENETMNYVPEWIQTVRLEEKDGQGSDGEGK